MKNPCDNPQSDLLPVHQALKEIRQSINPVSDHHIISLKNALGRILVRTILSPMDIPPDRISAMDGYAYSSSDIVHGQPFSLSMCGVSLAGNPYPAAIPSGQCIRVFTGAVIPDTADSVIMQEQVKVEGNNILFPAGCTAHENIRQAGSDRRKSETLLNAPKKMSAIDCSLLASAGIYTIPVKRKINIAFFSSGDELTGLGQPLQSGCIYDSNRYALNGLLKNPCFSVDDMGVIADNRKRLESTLISAAKTHDAIITTGGASVGDADYISEILTECGHVNFWKIAMKPGKPLAFGTIGTSLFFGLPGNPVSAIATFQILVLPALLQLAGAPQEKVFQLQARCLSDLNKIPGRKEYQRGIFTQMNAGEFTVETAGQQDSHHLSALSRANCYIVLPASSNGVKSGQRVTIEPFGPPL